MSSTLSSRLRRPGADAEPPPSGSAGRTRRMWSLLPMCAGFAVFGVIVWLAYQDASLGPPVGEPPLIKAAAEPIKLPPEEVQEPTLAAEQGTIGRLWSDAEQADQPERLLPPPEEPLSPPVIEAPVVAETTPGQPAGQQASEPRPDETAASEAGREDSATDVAALPSDTPAEAADPAPRQAPREEPTDESLQEAEAALDRLLAEVTALSEDAAAPAPAEDAAAPATPPAEEQSPTAATPDRAARPASQPAPTTTAAVTPEGAPPVPPAAPPQRPARATPPPTPTTSAEVRPAGALARAPAADAAAAGRSTEMAARAGVGTAISTPPVAPGRAFRIQLAAVRGEADARRAWDLFMSDLGPVLSDIEPIFERADTVNGVFYRVQIGPFGSQEAAESLCEELKQRNASCFVIRR